MGLGTHALAFGLGYALGHPTGRERARQVPGQLRELAARPETAQLAEKGKSLAGQAVQTVKQRVNGSSDTGATTGTGPLADHGAPTTGDAGPTATGEGTRRRRFPLRPRRRPGGIDAPTATEPGLIVAGSSGDPATDARSARVTDPVVAERTEAAMHGTLPPAAKQNGKPAS
jgi:hypothetical protein